MNIIINGKKFKTKSTKIAILIDELLLNKNTIVIEQNRVIIPKKKWKETQVSEGDVFEILSFVGGG